MPEQSYTDDDIPLQRQALLGFQKDVLEAGAATEGDDFILADYISLVSL